MDSLDILRETMKWFSREQKNSMLFLFYMQTEVSE